MPKNQTAVDDSSMVPVGAHKPSIFLPARDIPPVALSEILNEMGLSGPRVPAEQLIDHRFTIISAKPFSSAYQENVHAWFCVCVDGDTGETFTTVLGGTACVDILDALVHANFNAPLIVTLRWVEGGRFKGYYVLE